MLTIKDLNTEFLTEAVINKKIQFFLQDLKELKFNMANLRYGYNIRFDEIDESRIEVYDWVTSRAKTAAKSAIKKPETLFVGIYNNHIAFVFRRNSSPVIMPDPTQDDNDRRWGRNRYSSSYKSGKPGTYLDILPLVDEFWIIDIEGLDVSNLRQQRAASKSGVVENTPEYYRKVLEENLARYRKLGAAMRASKDNVFEPLKKRIEDAFARSMKLYDYFNNHPKEYTDYSKKNQVFNCITRTTNLLSSLRDFLDIEHDTKSSSGYGVGTEYWETQRNRRIENLKSAIEAIEFDLSKNGF